MPLVSPAPRLEHVARDWGVTVSRTVETSTSLLAYGRRGRQAVVLKLARRSDDESRSGAVLAAFDGRGAVRVLEHATGAVLMERLRPGTALATLVSRGRDNEAARILADVIHRMSPARPVTGVPTVRDWAGGFDRYLASDDRRIPRELVTQAQRLYLNLSASQKAVRLLHGDLHHDNVLHDRRRGWLAVDPKGVIGEVEYEVGAAMRNPYEQPDLPSDPSVVAARVAHFASMLRLDADRVLGWAFSQAVLSAIWSVEDDGALAPNSPSLLLARTTHAMLSSAGRLPS